MGGHCRKTVLLKTDYLVVGSLISRDWKHGSFGRKIETAVQYRARRGKLAIIPEDHWASYL